MVNPVNPITPKIPVEPVRLDSGTERQQTTSDPFHPPAVPVERLPAAVVQFSEVVLARQRGDVPVRRRGEGQYGRRLDSAAAASREAEWVSSAVRSRPPGAALAQANARPQRVFNLLRD